VPRAPVFSFFFMGYGLWDVIIEVKNPTGATPRTPMLSPLNVIVVYK